MMSYAAWIYSFILQLGGLIGYLKVGSKVSLVVATASALLMAFFGRAMAQGSDEGWLGAIILSSLLALFFAKRFYSSAHFMPSGMMMVLSLILVAYLAIHGRRA